MFVSVITVCHIVLATACFQLVDDRGPYKTQLECVKRIHEMVEATKDVWEKYKLDVRIADMKCERVGNGSI